MRVQTDPNAHLRRFARSAVAGLLAVVFTILWVDPVRAGDEVSVTPYRPSVSTPAALSAPGWVEVEAGLSRTRGGGLDHVDSLPYTVKLAFNEDWGVRIGGNALVRQRASDGSSLSGGGDTAIVLKHRWAIDDDSALGLEGGVSLPTAKSGLGSGGTDALLNGIWSADLPAELHMDLNLAAARVGLTVPGVARWQWGWAGALSHALSDEWGLGAELSGLTQRGAPSTAQWLAAASYSPSKAVTWDIGVSHGLTSASPGWSVFAGVTFLAGKLF